MDLIEALKHFSTEFPVLVKIGKYVLWMGSIFILITVLRRFLKKRLPNVGMRYRSQKGIEVLGYILMLIVTVFFFSGSIKDFGLAIGLLTAGITITLQELILSIAGSFFIVLSKVYKPGDRIELNGIKGDVIDVDSIYTTMMEIGEWVNSDNYSGRIVKISNAFVFKGPVYNYSQNFPFVWDEVRIPIRYSSDVELAKSIIIEIATKHLSEYARQAQEEWKSVVHKYYIEDAQINPTLAVTLTDNWIELDLRYIVDYKKRRATKSILNEEIKHRFHNLEGKVEFASATFEIVNIPVVNVKTEKPI
ncbi:mechanosensitive ion channel [Brumimicrobium glaciale]|uniref:Mechanosensitive ion channel n=1 Tax=Brumimicrobium glaciale TaxID=200475 RepID=A0A4Q4KSP0_9FLAO|nr:mechanosensitive ion channel domain-containing protein [Brumimicrobium glaciale]RYM35992.1 mechanosensitive ion channel [Brumimicrobium glaciale]